MSARGWSAAGTGEGDARAEAVGVEPFDASPTANFARSLSSSVVRPVGRGLGAGDAVRSAAGGEVEGVCVWPTPGLAGRCATKVFLRLLNADSARCDEDERDDRIGTHLSWSVSVTCLSVCLQFTIRRSTSTKK